jgi:hypothetical protein
MICGGNLRSTASTSVGIVAFVMDVHMHPFWYQIVVELGRSWVALALVSEVSLLCAWETEGGERE